MHAYHVILLLTCVLSTAFGTTVLARDSRELANRISSAIIFGGAWWAFCEVLWNQAEDADAAMFWVRLSALGWVWIGPLALHLMMELVGDTRARSHALLKFLYAFAGVYLIVIFATDRIHSRVVRTEWGWSYELAPAYFFYYAVTVASIVAGLKLAHRAYKSWPSQAERRQARGIGIGILIPLFVASCTDGIFPYLGIHVWHLGTTAITALAATVALTFYRYGYSLLAPGTFALEILETMPDGLALLHLDGRIRRANPAMVEMAGRASFEDLQGERMDELLEGFHVEAESAGARAEFRLRPRNGEAFPVQVSTALLHDRQGTATGLVVVLHDLREIFSLRQRLMLSGRMAAVGQLAAGVAHEINNPMAYVRANLSQLAQRIDELSQAEAAGLAVGGTAWRDLGEMIDESLEGVERTSAIVRDIKVFSHSGANEREVADLNELLDATLRIARPHSAGRARIELVETERLEVCCAPREIQQVFLNLLLNAIDSVSEQCGESPGAIRIRTWREGGQAAVSFEDEGTGISEEDLDRIFDPFFTTKPAGKGTGLGLSLSYEIVRHHGGEIRVESGQGRGTRFTVLLPSKP